MEPTDLTTPRLTSSEERLKVPLAVTPEMILELVNMGIKRRLDVIMAHIKAALVRHLRGRKRLPASTKVSQFHSSFHVKFLSCPAC